MRRVNTAARQARPCSCRIRQASTSLFRYPCSISCECPFGFQNQPPLPRRRVPKHFAGGKGRFKDSFIKAFWAEEYAGYDERFKVEAIAPIQNKPGQFLLNPVVRNILGQVRSKVDTRMQRRWKRNSARRFPPPSLLI